MTADGSATTSLGAWGNSVTLSATGGDADVDLTVWFNGPEVHLDTLDGRARAALAEALQVPIELVATMLRTERGRRLVPQLREALLPLLTKLVRLDHIAELEAEASVQIGDAEIGDLLDLPGGDFDATLELLRGTLSGDLSTVFGDPRAYWSTNPLHGRTFYALAVRETYTGLQGHNVAMFS